MGRYRILFFLSFLFGGLFLAAQARSPCICPGDFYGVGLVVVNFCWILNIFFVGPLLFGLLLTQSVMRILQPAHVLDCMGEMTAWTVWGHKTSEQLHYAVSRTKVLHKLSYSRFQSGYLQRESVCV